MTIRQILSRKLKAAMLASGLGLLLFVGSLAASEHVGAKDMTIVSATGHILMSTVRLLGCAIRINYCPFCGVSFDSEYRSPV